MAGYCWGQFFISTNIIVSEIENFIEQYVSEQQNNRETWAHWTHRIDNYTKKFPTSQHQMLQQLDGSMQKMEKWTLNQTVFLS